MMETGGRVKLIDFGIARFYKPGKQQDTTMMGTPGFAPPEQYGRGQTDARSDLFSFALVVFEALTGQLPYRADNYNKLLVTILTTRPTPPRDVRCRPSSPVRP